MTSITYLPLELEHITGSGAYAGVVMASSSLGQALGWLVAPLRMRTIPALTLVRYSLPMLGLGSVVLGLAAETGSGGVVPVMVCARIFMGALAATNEVASQATLYRMAKEDELPFLTALVSIVRVLGMLTAPVLGSLLYVKGGYPAPSMFVAVLTAVVELVFVIVVARLPPVLLPEANPNQQSVLQLLKVHQVWPQLLLMVCVGAAPLAIEPIAAPILTRPPYELSLQGVGGMLCLNIVGLAIGGTSSVQLYQKIGLSAQQACGLGVIGLGLLLQGPSSIFGFIPPSLGLWISSLLLVGFGIGVVGAVQPLALLRVLYHAAGKTKKDLAGALVATNGFVVVLSGVIFPPITASIFDSDGVGVTTTVLFAALMVLTIPAVAWNAPYLARKSSGAGDVAEAGTEAPEQ